MKKNTLVLIGLLACQSIAAQQETTDTASYPALEKRVGAIEKIVSKLPSVSGLINLRYQYDSASDANGFDIRRVHLNLKGELTKKLDYSFQAEFAGSPKILDAYVRYKLDRRFNLQVGEFKIPFSIENTYGPSTLETADNSLAISRLCNYSDVSGIASNGRDIGLSAYGGFFPQDGYNLVDYAVGVFNGNGINLSDNNTSKDFSGRLTLNPIRHLSVAGSYYNGSHGKTGDTHYRTRTGFGAKWEDKRLLIRSEYICGNTGGIKSQGAYAVAGYFLTEQLQTVAKYDYFQQDKTDAASKETDYSLGLNYYPVKFLRLQANYTYKNFRSEKDTHYLAVQLFALF